jgi:ABC-type Fe3+/spermidine/putrescine transport system ATPase subunit
MVRESNVPAILITHDRDDAYGVADQVGIIRKGRLLQLGTLAEVYHHPCNAFVGRFLGDANVLVMSDGRVRRARLGEGSVLLRPEHVQLVPAGTGRHTGSYLGTRPAGQLVRSFVDVDGTTIQANRIGDGQDVAYQRGDPVDVTWHERNVQPLESDPDDFDPTSDDEPR